MSFSGGVINTLLMGENGRCVSCCARARTTCRCAALPAVHALVGVVFECKLLRTQEKAPAGGF